MPGWIDPDLPPPLLERRPAPMNVGPSRPFRPPRSEQVNWPVRYGSQVRTILEVRWLNTVTFQVVRDRWDDAHPETIP